MFSVVVFTKARKFQKSSKIKMSNVFVFDIKILRETKCTPPKKTRKPEKNECFYFQ